MEEDETLFNPFYEAGITKQIHHKKRKWVITIFHEHKCKKTQNYVSSSPALLEYRKFFSASLLPTSSKTNHNFTFASFILKRGLTRDTNYIIPSFQLTYFQSSSYLSSHQYVTVLTIPSKSLFSLICSYTIAQP